MKRTIEVQEKKASDNLGYLRSRVTVHMHVTEDRRRPLVEHDSGRRHVEMAIAMAT